MQKRLHLVDTCIFIDLLRGKQSAIDFFQKFKGRIVISSISILELYRGAKTKEKKVYIQEFVKSFKHAHIDKDTIGKAMSIMKKYTKGTRDISIPDCLIAATAIINNLGLHTNNVSDFDFIQELKLNPKTLF